MISTLRFQRKNKSLNLFKVTNVFNGVVSSAVRTGVCGTSNIGPIPIRHPKVFRAGVSELVYEIVLETIFWRFESSHLYQVCNGNVA